MPDICTWIASFSSFLSSGDSWVKIAQVSSPILILIGVLVAVRSFRVNRSTNWYLKSVDVMLKCNERYDALQASRTDLVRRKTEGKVPVRILGVPLRAGRAGPHKEEIDAYFRRFWGLQVDQLDDYQLGMIERGVFVDWAIHKINLFKGDEVFDGTSFRERFDRLKMNEYGEKSDFLEFFEILQELSKSPEQSYDVLSSKLNEWLDEKDMVYRKRQSAWFSERLSRVGSR